MIAGVDLLNDANSILVLHSLGDFGQETVASGSLPTSSLSERRSGRLLDQPDIIGLHASASDSPTACALPVPLDRLSEL